MGRPWYSFYPADYARDTGHLSLVEHGVYRALMDHYYATAAPLPPAEERLLRICRAHDAGERDALRFVLAAFFIGDETGFRHRRIDAEIEKAATLTARASFAAQIGAAKRQLEGSQTSAKILPSQSQSHSQSRKIYKSRFEEFWSVYPRREAKAPARAAYAAALESAAPEVLIAAARGFAARRQGEDAAFTKLAATWLAQECWLDDVDAPAPPPPDDAALAALWGGRAAPLVAAIGAPAFQAYFGEAGFAPGPPARISVPAAYLRDLIVRKFTAALRRVFGEFELEVAG